MERVENKYLCSDYEIILLKQRLSAILLKDEHQTQEAYEVRSLYFDTLNDDCYHENESGVDQRKKYRIRIYPSGNDVVKFEIKSKRREKVKKDEILLTKEEADRVLRGQKSGKERVDFLIQKNMLQAKNIIQYERCAYVYPIGNVRITFDRNILTSSETNQFFFGDFVKIPLLEPHMHLMEVKYDEFLPDTIKKILELGNLKRVTFSKYYLGRQKIG